ncbi:MAG TPA: NAD-dependent epimerase/dehydratase family protein [Flavobacterium sp.]|uniref:NAD-dependent epimerase/dehydratase family protein n=1 Tax=Flavobacterium sp. TaxID=239 RepID=UPI002BE98A8F|nr:NAD-dependent epimerase/dehydratase family protein [Flavobacterium sp.]HNP34081.1 NAD-dependent epimerase/dehydratase family protein [Flavobacterium sp.]
MKILIIGSKGFIGSYAVKFFKQQNFEVLSCDVVTDYNDKNYFQIDATNSDYLSLFEGNKIDVCLNCSGAASVPLSIEFPMKDFNLNTVNVYKILESIRTQQSQCRFINLSSAAVYGNPVNLPISEEANLKPLSPYGIHKMQAEQICKEFYEYYGIKTCSLRIFSAYGNGLQKQLLWDLFKKFTLNPAVELFGTGNETRDFIHVEDVVQAVHLVINNASFSGEEINLANGEEYSIAYVAQLYKDILKSDKNIVFNQFSKPGDPLYWKADISKLKAMGYISNKKFEIGVAEYINWVQQLKVDF